MSARAPTRVAATPNALPDDAIARFRSDLDALTGGAGGLGVAVSGGPDSLALLLLVAAALPGRIRAATVDHRLRAESADEAMHVARIAADLGVPHDILHIDALPEGNVSTQARVARYAALEGWRSTHDLAWIATAHHAEDQRETLVMRMNRASGVAGMAGIRRVNGAVVRPLLGWRRAELAALVHDAGLIAVDDPSNRDDRYDRARVRKHLADADWLDPLAASRTADRLADADDALRWSAARIEAGDAVMADLPVELALRVLRGGVAGVDPMLDPRGETLLHALAELRAGRRATVGEVLCAPGEVWVFSLRPPTTACSELRSTIVTPDSIRGLASSSSYSAQKKKPGPGSSPG